MAWFFSLISLLFFFLIISHGLNIFSSTNALDFLAGPILFAFFAFFWLISGGRWMGLGDAKLALGVGWLLGFSLGISGIVLSFWIGAVISLALLGLQKMNISRFGLTIKSEIPFAPFIIFALLIELFTNWNLLAVLHI